jgi:hypothetical protein
LKTEIFFSLFKMATTTQKTKKQKNFFYFFCIRVRAQPIGADSRLRPCGRSVASARMPRVRADAVFTASAG